MEVGATDGVTDDLDDGAEEEEDEPTDGEFPGVGGSDGNGSDDDEPLTRSLFIFFLFFLFCQHIFVYDL